MMGKEMRNEVNEPAISYEKQYTYADYLLMELEERIEIIKGKIFKMVPAPARQHQKVSRNLQFAFMKYLEGSTCELYSAPFDVRLLDTKKSTADEDILTVVQPDLCIICDEEKLDQRGCIGAPDLIVEILSPGNTNREMNLKYSLYEENKVREYWLIDYEREIILIYVLENGVYKGLKPVTKDEIATSVIFPDFSIKVSTLF